MTAALTLTDADMRERCPAFTTKLQMIALPEGTYSKSGDLWYLLDPPRPQEESS